TGLVMDDDIFDLAEVHGLFLQSGSARNDRLGDALSVLGLLQDWERNFDALQSITAFLAAEGTDDKRLKSFVHRLETLQVLPPVIRPPKLLYAAANYREHVAGMRRTIRDGLSPIDPAKEYQADKTKSGAYLFFKGNNCLSGPYDDVVLPAGVDRIDWEAE